MLLELRPADPMPSPEVQLEALGVLVGLIHSAIRSIHSDRVAGYALCGLRKDEGLAERQYGDNEQGEAGEGMVVMNLKTCCWWVG